MLFSTLVLLPLVGSILARELSFEEKVAAHVPRKISKRDALPPIPADGTVYIGGWTNGQQGYSDTPAAMNARLNLSLPIYQFGQKIPIAPYNYVAGVGWYAQTYLIDWTNTNAAYFLTIYADDGLDAVTDGDLVALGSQLAAYEANGRTIYLRFLPEMQGNWNAYALQPTAFIALWKRMYAIIKEMAPSTVVVWSPNLSQGYPYGATLSQVQSAADKALLDTNGDGQLTAADDAYAPYFPGVDFVDANGISMYYKGPDFQNINQPQVGGWCAAILDGMDPYTGQQTTPFYSTYCSGDNLPCMISEIGAAYHVNVQGGSSQLQMQQAFWEDCITNSTFLDAYSEIKVINIFEQEKNEEDPTGYDLRDYRVSNVSSIASAFRDAMQSMGTRFGYATATSTVATGTALPTTNPVLVGTQEMTYTVTALSNEVITWTQTSFSSPTQTLVANAAENTAIVSQAVVAAVQSQSSWATGNQPLFVAASLVSVLLGALFVL